MAESDVHGALKDYWERYEGLVGTVPPRVQARFALAAKIDPEGLLLAEQIRAHMMFPDCFDTKTAQLILFAVLLGQLADGARIHALAARRAGATWRELLATVELVFLFRGMSAFNVGSEILAGIAWDLGEPFEPFDPLADGSGSERSSRP